MTTKMSVLEPILFTFGMNEDDLSIYAKHTTAHSVKTQGGENFQNTSGGFWKV